MSRRREPKIGLALGSGSARGWSHIGVIHALKEIGVAPTIVCGSSMGALVGTSYAAGNLDKLESWARSLDKLDIARFFEVNLSLNGFINRDRLHGFLVKRVCSDEQQIEEMSVSLATVSTDLETGREIWFTEGPAMDAVWASMALPGLFPPIRNQGRWLVDGGLVNPVPVSVCRALGADIVIAVNLNGHIVGKHFLVDAGDRGQDSENSSIISAFKRSALEYSAQLFPGLANGGKSPGLFDAIAGAVNITQDRITRSRMAGDPPDIMLAPRISRIGLLEYYRAAEAIEEGRQCVQRMRSTIDAVFEGV